MLVIASKLFAWRDVLVVVKASDADSLAAERRSVAGALEVAADRTAARSLTIYDRSSNECRARIRAGPSNGSLASCCSSSACAFLTVRFARSSDLGIDGAARYD